MTENPKKARLIIFSAVALIILLLVCSVFQIISINNKQREINNQQEEITRLQNELNYYENQKSDSLDDKNSDIDITVGEE